MSMYVNIGGVWKESPPKVNVGGTWKDVETGWVNVGGVWKSFFESSGQYQLLADITISTVTSQVDITGLNLNKNEEYVLVSSFVNGVGTLSSYNLFVNSYATVQNYYRQYIIANGTSVSTGQANDCSYAYTEASFKSLQQTNIKVTNSGYVAIQTNQAYDIDANAIKIFNNHILSTFTITSISTLSIRSTTPSAIGVGSKFQLYKIGGV